jgi:hypothetical protein
MLISQIRFIIQLSIPVLCFFACGRPDKLLYHGTLKLANGQTMFYSAADGAAYAVISMPERKDLVPGGAGLKVTAEAGLDFQCHRQGSVGCMSIAQFRSVEACD